jgi:hypothetical protein
MMPQNTTPILTTIIIIPHSIRRKRIVSNFFPFLLASRICHYYYLALTLIAKNCQETSPLFVPPYLEWIMSLGQG